MAFCSNCGTTVGKGKFCPRCGALIAHSTKNNKITKIVWKTKKAGIVTWDSLSSFWIDHRRKLGRN